MITYLKKLLHVYLDIIELQSRVQLSEILMLERLKDQTSSFEMRALDNIQHLDDVRVVKLFQNMIFSFDLGWLDRKQHLYHYLFFGCYVSPLEYVCVLSSAHLMRDCIVLQLS